MERELDANQFSAAIAVHGPSLILAGAGSGKTRAITYKIAHLISAHQVAPERILAVTFTNKAAREMRDRIGKLLGFPVQMPWMGTFHSICVRILRRCLAIPELAAKLGWKYSGSFSIYDDSDQKRLLRNILREMYGEVEAGELRKVAGRISACKNRGQSPEIARLEALGPDQENQAELFRSYQEKLMDANAMDFDDLLGRTVELLHNLPSVGDQFRHRLLYTFVDEYQDTNPVQYKLLQLLVNSAHNITVVGDDDQSIYGWRGADINIIRSFKDDFPGVQIFKLERNYRSTANIVCGAGSVIRNNPRPKGMDKRVFSLEEAGDPIGLTLLDGGDLEADLIARRILEAAPENYGKTAVFYRTNAQSRALEEALDRRRIPLIIYGGVRFYDRKEVKDILCYLRLLVNPDDLVSLERIFNVPRRGLGDTTWERLVSFASQKGCSVGHALDHAVSISGINNSGIRKLESLANLLQSMREKMTGPAALPLPVLAEILIAELQYKEWLLLEDAEVAADRLANLGELISAMVNYDAENPGASLDQFLQEIALLTDADGKTEEANSVRLMTLHAAKGLEFATVHLAGCDEGLLPLLRPGTVETPQEQKHRLEEERRLFYVGVTRACKKLYLYSARSRRIHGRDELFATSRFLHEIDPDAVEQDDRSLANQSCRAENRPFLRKSLGGEYRGGDSLGQRGSGWGKTPVNIQRKSIPATRNAPVHTPRSISAPNEPQVVYDEYSQENLYFRPGCIVMHARFGRGRVISCDGNDQNSRIRVLFGSETKTLVLRYAGLQLVSGVGDA